MSMTGQGKRGYGPSPDDSLTAGSRHSYSSGHSTERLSGAAVFGGTRVPVQTLIDYIEGGDSLEDILRDFPSVSREHAVAVLELARRALDAHASAA